jgi:hypothetical protein
MTNLRRGSQRRLPRWDQTNSRSVSYVKSMSLGRIPLTILDVSECGARVSTNGVSQDLRAGTRLEGEIILGDVLSLPIRFRVVHTGPSHMGVEFVDSDLRLSKAIKAFFGPVS